jgi:hypothetical protein
MHTVIAIVVAGNPRLVRSIERLGGAVAPDVSGQLGLDARSRPPCAAAGRVNRNDACATVRTDAKACEHASSDKEYGAPLDVVVRCSATTTTMMTRRRT